MDHSIGQMRSGIKQKMGQDDLRTASILKAMETQTSGKALPCLINTSNSTYILLVYPYPVAVALGFGISLCMLDIAGISL
jgi:hypothetical protein